MANSFAATTNFTAELDKQLIQDSVTGVFKDSSFGAKFIGTKTVSVPDLTLSGLGNYNRASGFPSGDVTVARQTYTLSMDRGVSFTVDRMDDDESGVGGLIGATSRELIRNHVAPEMDAYCLSKLYSTITSSTNKPSCTAANLASSCWTLFINAYNAIDEATGYGNEEKVCFVNPDMKAALENFSGFDKSIVYSDWKKGDVNMKVATINGVAILPVTSARMKSAFTFSASNGFTPATSAVDLYMLMMPKSAASLVVKTEKPRIFAPDTNQTADAYKIDYRVYYDMFTMKSKIGTIRAVTKGS